MREINNPTCCANSGRPLFDKRSNEGCVELACCSGGGRSSRVGREMNTQQINFFVTLLHKYTNIRCKAGQHINPSSSPNRSAGCQLAVIVTFNLRSHRHHLQSPSRLPPYPLKPWCLELTKSPASVSWNYSPSKIGSVRMMKAGDLSELCRRFP